MELIEKIKQALCDNSPFDDDKPDDYEGEAQAALTALIEYASGDGVTDGDREAAASGYFAWCSGNPVIPDRMKAGQADNHSMVQAFARHRALAFAAGFADGFTAALQGAEAVIWRIEDDAFLYENVSKALQEVISELQAMEQNWTGRVTIEHRQAAIKERDARADAARREALEEASKVARDYASKAAQRGWVLKPGSIVTAARHIATTIRALKGGQQ